MITDREAFVMSSFEYQPSPNTVHRPAQGWRIVSQFGSLFRRSGVVKLTKSCELRRPSFQFGNLCGVPVPRKTSEKVPRLITRRETIRMVERRYGACQHSHIRMEISIFSKDYVSI